MSYPTAHLVRLARPDNPHLSVKEIGARLFAVMNPIVPIKFKIMKN
jgi:hypothetical protein